MHKISTQKYTNSTERRINIAHHFITMDHTTQCSMKKIHAVLTNIDVMNVGHPASLDYVRPGGLD